MRWLLKAKSQEATVSKASAPREGSSDDVLVITPRYSHDGTEV